MRKISQTALSVLLCATMVFTSGCSLGGTKTKEKKADSEYVQLTDYKKVSLKKSEVDEQVQKQIDSTLDNYAEYKKKNNMQEIWLQRAVTYWHNIVIQTFLKRLHLKTTFGESDIIQI